MAFEIKNPFAISTAYGLQVEFPDKKTACDYLSRHNFIQDPYVFNAWYNNLSLVDAHISRIHEGEGKESFIVTYFAPHIERTRELPKRQKDTRFVKKLALVDANYA